MFFHPPDQYTHLDEIVKAIRQRMRHGQDIIDIAKDLGRFIPQDQLYLCYAAAAIMERDYGRKDPFLK